jgi:ATP-dependent Lon protease
MSCAHVFKSGKRKGLPCGRNTNNGNSYCAKHIPIISINSPQFLETLDILQLKYLALDTTAENKAIIVKKMRYLDTLSSSSTEYQKNLNWLRHALNFPYNKMIKIPVSIKTSNNKEISEYVTSVFEKLDGYIYGMSDVKEELLTFVAKRISNPNSTDHVLALQGPNGCGKTRLAHGLARALDLPIKTINLGSINDVSYFTGHGFTYVDSEPGRIIQILNETQCKNCIIYFDELDKIHKTDKGQSIYAFLTHLIDPTQNKKYQDVYLCGLELDVSNVFFVFSYNDEEQIDITVKDRLKIIHVQDPKNEDKVKIAEQFIIPEICNNINYNVSINHSIIERIVADDKYHSGLRGIRRVLEDIIAKMNVVRLLDGNVKNRMSFYDCSEDAMIEKIVQSHNREIKHYENMYS